MRIVGGSHRGRRLEAPADGAIRPTADRTREALFNILAHGPFDTDAGPAPEGMAVLDCFAGTGALGIEALSWGAATATFLEKAPAALALIRRNLRSLGLEDRATVRPADLARPGRAGAAFDLVLMDPPYDSDLGLPALAALTRDGWLADGAIVSIETARHVHPEPPPGFVLHDTRHYGRARLTLLVRRAAG